jgi:hypothetical protein
MGNFLTETRSYIMSKLSPTQERILKAAAKKPELDIREAMKSITNRAVYEKVFSAMLKNGLIMEGDQDGGLVYLISDAGLEAVGKRKRPTAASKAEETASALEVENQAMHVEAESSDTPQSNEGKTEVAKAEPKTTKLNTIIIMLKREEGATLKQMMEATGWQRHSLHGAMAGGLKKKQGLTIISSKEKGGERIYRIA